MPCPVRTSPGQLAFGSSPACSKSACSRLWVPESSPRLANGAGSLRDARDRFGRALRLRDAGGIFGGARDQEEVLHERAVIDERALLDQRLARRRARASPARRRCRRAPIFSAAPLPTAISFTWMPVSFSKSGSSSSIKPESRTLVVVASTSGRFASSARAGDGERDESGEQRRARDAIRFKCFPPAGRSPCVRVRRAAALPGCEQPPQRRDGRAIPARSPGIAKS